MDWTRGKIPFFVPPPGFNENTGEKINEGKENLNENEENVEDENKKVT